MAIASSEGVIRRPERGAEPWARVSDRRRDVGRCPRAGGERSKVGAEKIVCGGLEEVRNWELWYKRAIDAWLAHCCKDDPIAKFVATG